MVQNNLTVSQSAVACLVVQKVATSRDIASLLCSYQQLLMQFRQNVFQLLVDFQQHLHQHSPRSDCSICIDQLQLWVDMSVDPHVVSPVVTSRVSVDFMQMFYQDVLGCVDTLELYRIYHQTAYLQIIQSYKSIFLMMAEYFNGKVIGSLGQPEYHSISSNSTGTARLISIVKRLERDLHGHLQQPQHFDPHVCCQ